MYQALQPLNPDTQQHQHYRPYSNFLFAEGDMAVELVFRELGEAMVAMPLGFMRRDGRTQLMALLSVIPGKNTYVNAEGKWIGGYVPAVLRGYPFCAVPRADNPEKPVMCVDQAALTEPGPDTRPLFNDAGEPSDDLRPVLTFWEMIAGERRTTNAACDALEEAGLITPWAITVRDGDNEQPLTGFYRIDEDALNDLSGDALTRLRDSGALTLAYAQLLSQQRLPVLQKATTRHANQMARHRELDEQLDGLFGDDDDELEFGF